MRRTSFALTFDLILPHMRQGERSGQCRNTSVAQAVDLSAWHEVHGLEILYSSVMRGAMNANVCHCTFTSAIVVEFSACTTRGDRGSIGFALCRRNLLEGLDGDLLIAAFDADHHLILIADWHFQLHGVVLLHDGPGGADASIQQAL
jgi:hypothetical protein